MAARQLVATGLDHRGGALLAAALVLLAGHGHAESQERDTFWLETDAERYDGGQSITLRGNVGTHYAGQTS